MGQVQIVNSGGPWTVGLLGCGVVGSAVVRALRDTDSPLARQFELKRVAVRNPGRSRDCPLDGHQVATSALEVANDPSCDVVVEVMGGTEPAGACVRSALSLETPVVTANKTLVGQHGPALRRVAADNGVRLRFEAAVAAAIPAIRTVEGYLAHDRIERIEGVLNGTCNYVLGCVSDGVNFEDALAKAQACGFAEADATRDLDGRDAADKAAILSQVVWGHEVRTPDVHTLGIDWLGHAEVQRERRRGRVWRLIATVTEDGCARVEPRPVPADHPFAQLTGPENALTIHARRAGRLFLSGPGAGGDATAAAIIADLAELKAACDAVTPWLREPAPAGRPRREDETA